MITNQDLKSLVKAAQVAGFVVDEKKLKLLTWNAGSDTHKPTVLEVNYFAVYIFKHKKKYLKVGKVSGAINNDRYYQHHYLYNGANSTLAKSLVNCSEYSQFLNCDNVRTWIIENTTRFNVLIPKSYGKNFVNFSEAFFILKCNPKFEGKS